MAINPATSEITRYKLYRNHWLMLFVRDDGNYGIMIVWQTAWYVI